VPARRPFVVFMVVMAVVVVVVAVPLFDECRPP
jgi:hypothetical protein